MTSFEYFFVLLFNAIITLSYPYFTFFLENCVLNLLYGEVVYGNRVLDF
ncbi:hypothetical protein DSUL_150052 [Desulfovibrionales bacterium]